MAQYLPLTWQALFEHRYGGLLRIEKSGFEHFKTRVVYHLGLLRTEADRHQWLLQQRVILVEKLSTDFLAKEWDMLLQRLQNEYTQHHFYSASNAGWNAEPVLKSELPFWRYISTGELLEWLQSDQGASEQWKIILQLVQQQDYEAIADWMATQLLQHHFKKQRLAYLDQVLCHPDPLVLTPALPPHLEQLMTALKSIDLQPIYGRLNQLEIRRFFDFLGEQNNLKGKPFLPASALKVLQHIGLSLPAADPPLKLHLNMAGKDKGVIYYCFYKLWECHTEYKNSGRVLFARFLQTWFDNFSIKEESLTTLLKDGRPPSMHFDLFGPGGYLPKPN